MTFYNELKTEILNDPVSLGYSSHRWHDSTKLASLLNTPRQSISDIWNTGVDCNELRTRVAKSDYISLSADNRAYLEFLFGGDSINTSLSQIQTDIGELFPAGSITRAAWLSISRRKPTRAEELWGVNTVIHSSDVDIARDI